MSGGVVRAAEGDLTFLASGSKAAFDGARHHRVDHLGEGGRVLVAGAGPLLDAAHQRPAQHLRRGAVAFEVVEGGPLQVGRAHRRRGSCLAFAGFGPSLVGTCNDWPDHGFFTFWTGLRFMTGSWNACNAAGSAMVSSTQCLPPS
ncbi:hypothetical protein ACFQ12_11035 [Methylobacterium trifolii]